MGLDPSVTAQYCSGGPTPDNATVVELATSAFMNASAAHGYFWLDDEGDVEANATECVAYLFAGMPRRDMQLLFSSTYETMDFIVETVRYAERAWSGFTAAYGVPWPVFLDAVLPHAVYDEKRDLSWRWRPRFAQLFGPLVAGAPNLTAAMHALAAAIPNAQPLGALGYLGVNATGTAAVPGPPISWHSEVSPAYLSPQQVSTWGGSCTGTGIVLVAAARAVGIPARLAGCSQSIPNDDHHWSEYYDPSAAGPFGDYWHTKEGTSYGNEGGPWDSPSGPMDGCLSYAVAGSTLNTLWSASYGSDIALPTLWANSSWTAAWSRIGGVNRCGAYCGAWGCGVNQTQHWTQAECGPVM
jgi:hypothetical protein